MKRIFGLTALLLLTASAYAQPNNPSVRYVASAPSGACSASPPIQVVISTGVAYTCKNGTWGALAGGGSGTVTTLSVATANGVAGSVADPTTTPAITLTLGDITPTAVTIPNDGVHPNQLALPWGPTANPAPTNAMGWEGPVSATGTPGWFDLPNALPTVPSVMVFAAPVGGAANSVPTLTAVSTVSGQAANVIGKASGANAITAQSALSDNGSTVSSTEPITIGSGNQVSIGALGGATNWSFDTTTPATALASLGPISPTMVYDDFKRGNGNLTAPWTKPIAASTIPQISGNFAVCSTSDCDAYYAASIGPNQYIEVVVTTLPTGTDNLAIYGRLTPGTLNNQYRLYYIVGTGYVIYKFINSTPTALKTVSGTLSAGDTYAFRLVGTILTGYKNGAPVIEVVDGAITTGNYAGILIGDSTVQLGPFVAAAY